jgi:SAM-dependent methyltransferase
MLRQGISVVGVDLNMPMLERAKERIVAAGRRMKAPWHLLHGDMRALPLAEGAFHRIICPFNTFMHLYLAPDITAALREIHRLLHPQMGRFIFDVLNPDLRWLTRDPAKRWAKTHFKHPETGQRYLYSTNHTYDPRRQICFVNIYYDCLDEPARSVRQMIAHRQFFPQELYGLLRHHGFLVEREYGDFHGHAFEGESTELVLVCRRA